jgi:hypothetical protein
MNVCKSNDDQYLPNSDFFGFSPEKTPVKTEAKTDSKNARSKTKTPTKSD